MGSKDDSIYIEQALEEIQTIIEYTSNLSYEEFLSDKRTIDATMFRLQQMAEKLKKLSASFKSGHPEIPWSQIIGFRNEIVHEYGRTDFSIVYAIVTKDLCDLREILSSTI